MDGLRRARRRDGRLGGAGHQRQQRPDVARHVRRDVAHRRADRAGRARRPLGRAQRDREHRPRGHDDHGDDLRRLVGLADGSVDGDRRRRHRRDPRRPLARPGHRHVRRQPHRVRLRHQHHRPRRGAVHGRAAVRRRGRHRDRGRLDQQLAGDVEPDRTSSRCRSCRAATSSAGRRPTPSAGWPIRSGSSCPTSPAW